MYNVNTKYEVNTRWNGGIYKHRALIALRFFILVFDDDVIEDEFCFSFMTGHGLVVRIQNIK